MAVVFVWLLMAKSGLDQFQKCLNHLGHLCCWEITECDEETSAAKTTKVKINNGNSPLNDNGGRDILPKIYKTNTNGCNAITSPLENKSTDNMSITPNEALAVKKTITNETFARNIHIDNAIIDNDVNQLNKYGESPLHIACYKGDKERVKILIDHNADVNQLNEDGKSPLHIACDNDDKEIVVLLLSNKAHINRCDRNGKCPLSAACLVGHLEIVEILLRHQANINKCDINGLSPMGIASEKGDTEMVKLLLRYMENVNRCDAYEKSPLYKSCANGHLQVVQILLNNNADINKCCRIGQVMRTFREQKSFWGDNFYNHLGYGNLFSSACDANIVRSLLDRKKTIKRCNTAVKCVLYRAGSRGYDVKIHFSELNFENFSQDNTTNKKHDQILFKFLIIKSPFDYFYQSRYEEVLQLLLDIPNYNQITWHKICYKYNKLSNISSDGDKKYHTEQGVSTRRQHEAAKHCLILGTKYVQKKEGSIELSVISTICSTMHTCSSMTGILRNGLYFLKHSTHFLTVTFLEYVLPGTGTNFKLMNLMKLPLFTTLDNITRLNRVPVFDLRHALFHGIYYANHPHSENYRLSREHPHLPMQRVLKVIAYGMRYWHQKNVSGTETPISG